MLCPISSRLRAGDGSKEILTTQRREKGRGEGRWEEREMGEMWTRGEEDGCSMPGARDEGVKHGFTGVQDEEATRSAKVELVVLLLGLYL